MLPISDPRSLRRLFSLRRDMASPDSIDAAVRDGVKVGGTNLWALMFAIAIASIGLNVNSTAVIIGAMLISPLMGPIIGAGYGAGIQDAPLIRLALRNLAVLTGISLAVSTLYFLLTPLEEAQSELLARTSPTLWDVLIAFFGGAAGMVGLTRKEKSTLIPGVAIATALMPPLCTAGYGLATGQLRFFFGAFYLFTINSVFIAFATLLFTRYLRLPAHPAADAAEQRRVRLLTGIAVTVTLVPSIVLALHLVRAEVFGRQANRFVAALEAESPDRVVLRRTVDASQRRITLTLLGEDVTPALQRELEARLAAFRLEDTQLELRRPGDPRHEAERAQREFAALQQEQTEAQRRTLGQLEESRRRVAELEHTLAEREAGASAARERHAKLAEEIRAQFPQARHVRVAVDDAEAQERLLIVVDARPELAPRDLARLRAWLAVRLGGTDGAAGTAFELVVGRATA
jgi:uncharacterized hydrophobic protein (TIGR00271 family)